MSKVQFLTIAGHPVKLNSSLVMSIEKGQEGGPNIVLNFIDGRVSVFRFPTEEERDSVFDSLGTDGLDVVQKWAMDLFQELKPMLAIYLEKFKADNERMEREQKEYEEWLKDNPPGSPGNPIFNAGIFQPDLKPLKPKVEKFKPKTMRTTKGKKVVVGPKKKPGVKRK